MSVVTTPVSPAKLLTYEEYLAEDEINLRYDIVDGERIFMASPKWWHQRISKNLTLAFGRYEENSRVGQSLAAPYDILIRRRPLRTRQPDLFFISNARLAGAGDFTEAGFLEIAPECVVEIVSSSETENILNEKITDYCAIGVLEGWIVRRTTRTVTVQRLTPDGPRTAATYGAGETVQSLTFPDLTVSVDALFAE